MRNKLLTTIHAGAMALALGAISVPAAAPPTPQGIITEKVFLNIGGGTAVTDLTGNAKFPNNPDILRYPSYCEIYATGDIGTPPANDVYNNSGAQLIGYFYPEADGDYWFYISADDTANLYLSTDDKPENKKLIAQETGWSNPRNYSSPGSGTAEPKNSSTFTGTEWPVKDASSGGAKITLVKGKAYYIEALEKEGSGGDNLSVSIDGVLPIPGSMLSCFDKTSGPVTITQQPASLTVVEGQSASFSVVADGLPPYTYQWQQNNSDLADATNATLTLAKVTPGDNNAKFKVKVTNAQGTATSGEAILTVTADTTAPTVAKVTADTTFTSIVIQYSEPVSDTAVQKGNYAIDQGATIASVTRVDQNTVKFTTSTLTGGLVYTITINGVADMAATPNTIAANTKAEARPFVFMMGAVVRQKYGGFSDGDGGNPDNLFNDPRYPAAPDSVKLLSMWEYPANGAGRDSTADPTRNYFDCIEGFFLPPSDGNYVFFTSGADRWWLYLSTDENPANKHVIAAEPGGWTDARYWLTTHDTDPVRHRSDLSPYNVWPDGTTITLQKNKKYYMLLVHHDPSWCGGDFYAATFKLEAATDPTDGSAPILTGNVIGTYLDPTGASVTYTKQPESKTIVEGHGVKLTAEATGESLYGNTVTYQWQSAPKGGSTFTDIAGATQSTYYTPNLGVGNDGTQYRVIASVPGLLSPSSVAVISVLADTFPPKLLGASAFANTKSIGVMFDEDLDPVSAQTAANYLVNGVAATSAVVRTNVANEKSNEKNLVQLTVNTAVTANFTLQVTGVKDPKGNAMAATSVTGEIVKLTNTDIGSTGSNPGAPDPSTPSVVTTWGPGAFDVLCNGNDYWNNADGFNFLWEAKTNSFDVKVRVVSVAPINNWSAGAIEVREGPPTANGGGWELARHYFAKVDAGGEGITTLDNSGTGANQYEFNARLAPGDPTLRETSNDGQGGSRGQNGVGPGSPGGPPWPNAWIRVQRIKQGTNDTLVSYSSNDGESWSERMRVDLNDTNHAGFADINGNPAGKWPDVCYVGLGSTSHTGVGGGNNVNEGAIGEYWYSPIGQPYRTYVIYRDYGDVASAPTMAATRNADGTVTLTYTGVLYSAESVNGSYAPVAGATSPYVLNPGSSGKLSQFYRSGP